MDIHEFCKLVSQACEKDYDVSDGGDLCFTLIERGQIDVAEGVDAAARIVAHYILYA